MYKTFIAASAAFALCSADTTTSRKPAESLYVENAPNYVRPYVIEHYANAQAVAIGAQIYRFPVTGPSSGGAFSLLSTSSPSSDSLGVLPHIHQAHHENFFCFKGRFQLWTEKNDDEQARLLTPGDYGSVPRNTTHTFQILDPDTEMLGVIAPGGFEDLFFFLADSNYTAATHTPFVPASTSNSAGSGSSSAIITALESYDVYAQLTYSPRRDLINGTAPSSSWHTAPNALPSNASAPFFVAKDYGPKFLNNKTAAPFYQLVQPFVTPRQSYQGSEMVEGTITLSRYAGVSAELQRLSLPGATALEVLEGALTVEIEGFEAVTLIAGDVAFVPANVPFAYFSRVWFTKVLYVGVGKAGIDQKLLRGASAWDYAVFPTA